MRTSRRSKALSILTVVALLWGSGRLHAQEDRSVVDEQVLGTLAPEESEEPQLGFYDTADLSLVITGGNSAATTIGLRNLAEYYWTRSSLRLDLGGLRTDARSREDRVAVGTGPEDFSIVEAERKKTAENYFANLRYDYDLAEHWYLFGIGGWERNQFAGFDDRWQGALGLGWQAIETERTKLSFDVAGTYTSESPTVGGSNEFGGIRLAYDFEQKVGGNTTLFSTLVLDENLKETEDLRADWFNAIELSITEILFLRTSFRIQWRNEPLYESLLLYDANGDPVVDGTGQQVSVMSQLDPVDTYFLTSLVLKL